MIGVLAIQGGFKEHIDILNELGFANREVRSLEDLKDLNGLIIPGGESTVMAKFLDEFKMRDEILKLAKNPEFKIYGTCAGLILLADEVENLNYKPLGLLNVKVLRNAYGRQLSSFTTKLGSFIRAPKIVAHGKNVEVIETHEGDAVLVRQGNIWGSTFHPELIGVTAIHKKIFS
jgi:5'-phosphate synthase pdxT subunit